MKRHICLKEWCHKGFLSRGGSWEEGRIRNDAKTPVSIMLLTAAQRHLENLAKSESCKVQKRSSICLALVSSKEHKAFSTLDDLSSKSIIYPATLKANMKPLTNELS